MAEFQEVMKQWRKMMAAKLRGEHIPERANYTVAYNEPNEFEEVVMGWAKEHPEPVYPSLADLMYGNFLIWCQTKYPGRAKDAEAWFDYLYETPIPTEIAEKLGIEPKEG